VREPPEIAEQAMTLVRRLVALEEGSVRARAAARALDALGPERAARVLAALVCRGGEEGASVAIGAVAQAFLDPGCELPAEWHGELYVAALRGGHLEVAGMLLSPPPHRAWAEPLDKADPRLAHLSLGEKKTLARLRRDPDLLARLAAEGEPSVVRELLRNPRLTEPFAVRIASRRPMRPETLRCLFEDRRWRTRAAVRLALARNPYVDTGIALLLLPTLQAGDLADIADDGALHPRVREQAGRIAEGRGWGRGRDAGG
jgi:hypothetical protein